MADREPIAVYYGAGQLHQLISYRRVVLQPGFYSPPELAYLAEQDVQSLAYLALSEDHGPLAPWQRPDRNPDWGGAFVYVGHPEFHAQIAKQLLKLDLDLYALDYADTDGLANIARRRARQLALHSFVSDRALSRL